MKTIQFKISGILASVIILGLGVNAIAQDDLYYMPSKDKSNEVVAVPAVDTSGMTNYEKYRALREGDSSNSNVKAKNDTPEVANQPDLTTISYDSSNVYVNNYYVQDDPDRFWRYRSFGFDYYYPYGYCGASYYDPYFYGYGWGYPYFGFSYGYSSWSLGFYWSYPYYSGYYGYPYYHSYYHGFYDGYYYSDNYYRPRGNYNYTPGRRAGGFANTIDKSTKYYGGRYSGADFYHGTRRGANYSSGQVSGTNGISRRNAITTAENNTAVSRRSATSNTRYTQYNNVQSNTRRYSNTPAYILPPSQTSNNNAVTRRYSNSPDNSTYNRRQSTSSENSSNVNQAPRRRSESYTPSTNNNSSNNSNNQPVYRRETNNSNSGSYSAPSNSGNSRSSSGNSGGGRRR